MREPPGIQDSYELTPLQQGMLIDTLREPGVGLYINQSVEVVGAADASALTGAWQQVVDRHTILRTSFAWHGRDTPRQLVHRHAPVDVTTRDWRGVPSREQRARLQQFLAEDRDQGFDLTKPPLLRLALLRRSEADAYVVVSHHHLLLDGWSRPLLLDEVRRCAEAVRRGERAALPLARPFGEFVAWLRAQDVDSQRAFWSAYLDGVRAPTPVPFDNGPQDGHSGSRFGELAVRVPAAPLRAFARRWRVTVNTVLTGAWALLLGRHAGGRDVVFGIVASGRPPLLQGAESMIGMFMNSVALRVHIDGGRPLADWLRDLLRSQIALREHEHTPLMDVLGWSALPVGSPLFETMVVDQSAGHDRRGTRPVAPPSMRQSLPLVLATDVGKDEVLLTVTYDARRLDAGSIVRMTAQLRTLLESMVHGAEASVDSLQLMSAEERQRVVVEWNRTTAPRPADVCLHELFEAQAARTPERAAVTFEDRVLTYLELDRQANRLAGRLRGLGVGPGDPVGVCVERSLPMATAVLAVLKAGGAVLPLDPGYPLDRLRYMLRDARAPVLLTTRQLAGQFDAAAVDHVVQIDDGASATPDGAPAWQPCPTHPEHPAFLLYTSGSTGSPKGVAIPHRVAVNRVHIEHDRFEDGEVLCGKTSLSFIDSIWELFGAWHHGLCIALVPEGDVRDTRRLVDALASARATRIVLVPSLLRALFDTEIDLAARLPRLRQWISSGEPLAPDLCGEFARRLPDAVLTNLYGITEVWDATRCDSREFAPGAALPIGRPMGNVRAYIVDENLDPVPIGVEGELCIAGDGLARGYWRRPALTAERFVPDPFGERGERLYRTGDRARWRANGNLDYLGRVDNQIKLHGFRIEPAEIERALREHGAVAEAAVVLAGDRERLAAFIVTRGDRAPRADELRTLLRRRLPEHMVPGTFLALDRLPMTPSGKVDRNSLVSTDVDVGAQLEPRPPSRPPATPTEETIAALWTEVLHVDAVGAESDFFDLGGNSLLAMRMLARLADALGVEVPPSVVFEERTLAALAARVDALPAAPAPSRVTSVNREATAPLACAQEGLWFLDQLNPGSVSHTIPASIRFSGPVDDTALRAALAEVVRRHEALRTTFVVRDGRPSQLIHAPADVEMPVVDTAPGAGTEDLASLPWDLSEGPLLRARLLRRSPREHELAITMHHIITDGASMSIFARELAATYRAFTQRRPCPFPELALQFADFAIWQQEWMRGPECERQRDYWRRVLSGAEVLALPTDHPPMASQHFRGGQRSFDLSAETTARLRALAHEAGVTTFMVLLAVYQLFLSRCCGQDDIAVGTAVANRHRGLFQRVIGFFVNAVTLRTSVAGDPTFGELVSRVAGACVEAYDHADLPFDKVVEAVNPARVLGRHPLFQAMLVYQGRALGAMELPGVSWRPQSVELQTSNFDLLLVANDSEEGMSLTLRYDADLFDASTIDRVVGQLHRLTEQVAGAPGERISTFRMDSRSEQRRILTEWSGARRRGDAGARCVHELFSERARKTPERIAVRYRDTDVSFAELDRRSTALARSLRARGVGPEVVVGLWFERSPDAIVAMLATLKAGGAFLVLDPKYPAQRLEHMLKDSGASLVLAGPQDVDAGPAGSVRDVPDRGPGGPPHDHIASGVGPGNLAYVVYTSGSTGVPRGVEVEHRNLASVIRAQIDAFGIDADSRVMQLLSLSFDAAIGEIFRALVAGATLVLADDESALPGPGLVDTLRRERITVAAITPASLALVPHDGALPTLRTLIVGGEPCPIGVADRWRRSRRLINGYGPTETTIGATMAADWPPQTPAPLGRPLPGVSAYVLDRAMEPTPAGVPGELYVGGVGVARGYRNRPGDTAERFVPDPFGEASGERLYRTGDLARWSPEGVLEFLDRVDRQVKIRGHRVEPAEVETALGAHEDVDQCVADVRSSAGDEQLVAYATARPGHAPTPGELRSFLRDRLPDHLVPAAVVLMPAIPINANGKVDRDALPAPTTDRSDDHAFVAPRNETESALARIWEEVLGLDRVGVHSNFFELGGDSLRSIRVVARAADAGMQLTAQELFRNQTIAQLAEAVGACTP